MRRFTCLKLHHVNIVVHDLEVAREFYCNTLGLQELDRPNFATRGIWLSVGDAQIHIAEGDETAPRRHHFALVVDDLDAAIEHLESTGVVVQRFPTVDGAGAQAGCRDPSGNSVELRQAD